MNGIDSSVVVVPGVVALLLFLVFSYLYEQSRQIYFRAWQMGWGFYTLHYVLDAWAVYRKPSVVVSFFGALLLAAMTLCVLVSTRLTGGGSGGGRREPFRLRWFDAVAGIAGVALSFADVSSRLVGGVFHPELMPAPYFRVEVGCAVVLLYASLYFYRHGHRRNSVAFSVLALALAFWAALMAFGEVRSPFLEVFGVAGSLLGPV